MGGGVGWGGRRCPGQLVCAPELHSSAEALQATDEHCGACVPKAQGLIDSLQEKTGVTLRYDCRIKLDGSQLRAGQCRQVC